MLRVLEESQFERVGGTQTKKVDVRIVAASNKDLLKRSEDGSFREDLFYRLNVVPITVPPLRKRTSDLPLIADYLLEQASEELGIKKKKISKRTLDVLKEYTWPGNIRELKNLIERLVILTPGSTIDVGDLPVLGPAKNIEEQFFEKDSYNEFREAMEKEFFTKKLTMNGFNVSKTARKLGMQRSNLYKKLEKYQIPYKRTREDEEEGEE